MEKILLQLEKESQAIHIASGLKLATQIAKNLDAYKELLQYVKDNTPQLIKVLEKVEEVTARPIDEKYANPNDSFVFTLIILLKECYYQGIENSGKLYLAQKCAGDMKNSYWSTQVRYDNFLDRLYDIMQVSRSDAIDEVYHVIPDLVIARKFDQVNSILENMDVTKVNTSIMYSMLHLVSRYVNQLPYYNKFWQKVWDHFMFLVENPKPDAKPADIYTVERVEKLVGKYKNGPSFGPIYNPEEDDKPRKSHTEIFDEKLIAKIAWAKEIGDKDLEDMLTYYKLTRDRKDTEDREYRRLSSRLGDKELTRQACEALRAMADYLEKSGPHFMIHCQLPNMPIFSGKDHVERYHSHIEISMVACPLGG